MNEIHSSRRARNNLHIGDFQTPGPFRFIQNFENQGPRERQEDIIILIRVFTISNRTIGEELLTRSKSSAFSSDELDLGKGANKKQGQVVVSPVKYVGTSYSLTFA
ncbi:hypothetical protein STEG23_005923 [Scotinomys teguina]